MADKVLLWIGPMKAKKGKDVDAAMGKAAPALITKVVKRKMKGYKLVETAKKTDKGFRLEIDCLKAKIEKGKLEVTLKSYIHPIGMLKPGKKFENGASYPGGTEQDLIALIEPIFAKHATLVDKEIQRQLKG